MEIGRGHALLLILILVGIKRNIINPRGTTIIRVGGGGGVGIAGSALYAWVMNHQGHRPCTTTNTMGWVLFCLGQIRNQGVGICHLS